MNTEIETSSREVWAADEIPFDVAFEVVKREMENALNSVIALPGKTSIPSVEFQLIKWDYKDKVEARWRVVKDLCTVDCQAPTLQEALSGLPSAESIRVKAIESARKKKAKLEAELAKLEGEEIPNNQAA